jgi:hypothetical protein
MLFPPSIAALPKQLLVALGAVAALLIIWLWARYGRRRYLVIKKSDATEALTHELSRIADALERLAVPRETQPTEEQKPPRRVNWMSMFGR